MKTSRYFMDETGEMDDEKNNCAESIETFVIGADEIDIAKRKSSSFHKNIKHKEKEWRKPKIKEDPFPGKAKLISDEQVEIHDRGPPVRNEKIRPVRSHRKAVERQEAMNMYTVELAARSQRLLLLNNNGEQGSGDSANTSGCIEPDQTLKYTGLATQSMIKNHLQPVDAAKGFDLNLKQYAPYRIDYSLNGRHLLLGGYAGHIAALDWNEKKLRCEINVQQSIHDVKWLHTENMFAVAQKKWTFIYDNQGVELHCLKVLDNVIKMEFLPYHFILSSINDRGYLSWLDVSIGKMVAQFPTYLGSTPSTAMCQNPANAIITLGHPKGIVSMWSANMRQPVAKILAQKQPVVGVAIDKSGHYMATCGIERTVKVWDVRQFKCLKETFIPQGPSALTFSGNISNPMLGVSTKNDVRIYKLSQFLSENECEKSGERIHDLFPYMKHKLNYYNNTKPTHIQFVPNEDVMGIGHGNGFTSILVPGSGEPNFDSREVNPYQTKSQRRESEVKSLLDKIPSDLITIDTSVISCVDQKSAAEQVLESNARLYLKPKDIDFEPRSKSKGKSGTAKRFHVKRTVKDELIRRDLKEKLTKESRSANREGKSKKVRTKPKSIIDRLT